MLAMVLLRFILVSNEKSSGPGSVCGIATAYGLDGPGIESCLPFLAPAKAGRARMDHCPPRLLPLTVQ